MKRDFLIKAGVACFLAAQPAMHAHAQTQDRAPAAETQECPARQLRPPKYPMSVAKAGRGGHGMVSVAFDACGRVTDARMAVETGSRELDQASLEAARTWTLGKPAPEWKLVDGRYEAPVDFFPPVEIKSASPTELGWPTTHRRPRYALEGTAGNTPTLAEAQSLISKAFLQRRIARSGYREGVFVATGSTEAPEFWYQSGNVAARYRPVMENGEAVVKVALVCTAPQEDCAQREADALKGLPFARARN